MSDTAETTAAAARAAEIERADRVLREIVPFHDLGSFGDRIAVLEWHLASMIAIAKGTGEHRRPAVRP